MTTGMQLGPAASDLLIADEELLSRRIGFVVLVDAGPIPSTQPTSRG
jgi:hypothetical protein